MICLLLPWHHLDDDSNYSFRHQIICIPFVFILFWFKFFHAEHLPFIVTHPSLQTLPCSTGLWLSTSCTTLSTVHLESNDRINFWSEVRTPFILWPHLRHYTEFDKNIYCALSLATVSSICHRLGDWEKQMTHVRLDWSVPGTRHYAMGSKIIRLSVKMSSLLVVCTISLLS